MNLLTPPFDDPHVRKAVNYVIDKAALVKALRRVSLHADPATTVDPPSVNCRDGRLRPVPVGELRGRRERGAWRR